MGTYSDDRQPALDRLLLEPARAGTKAALLSPDRNSPRSIQWPHNVKRIVHLSTRPAPRFLQRAKVHPEYHPGPDGGGGLFAQCPAF